MDEEDDGYTPGVFALLLLGMLAWACPASLAFAYWPLVEPGTGTTATPWVFERWTVTKTGRPFLP